MTQDSQNTEDRRTQFMFATDVDEAAAPSEPELEPTEALDAPGTRPTIPMPLGGRTMTHSPSTASPIPTPTPLPGAGSGFEGPSRWETLALDGQLEPGQAILGKYEVIRLLGRGGMGAVWLVRHQHLGVERALKLIVAQHAFEPRMLARIRQEARIMAAFAHPHAVIVHDAVVSQEAAYIDMECIHGTSLASLLVSGQPMPLDWIGRILVQLCDALQAAHDLGIIHRDLSPSNLMLLDGRPAGKEFLKVVDFGIAKLLDSGISEPVAHTMTGCYVGKPQYSSPEQVQSLEVDARSDLYSVGVILYELLTGHRPFTGPPMSQLFDHCHKEPPTFEQRNPAVRVPPEVERVVMRCLAKDPANRPQSARDLADEFLRALPLDPFASTALGAPGAPAYPFSTGSGTLDALPLTPIPAPVPVRSGRHRIIGISGGILALGIAAGAGLVYLAPGFGHRAQPPEPAVATPTATASTLPPGYRPEDPKDLVAGWPRVLIRDSDGTRFIRLAGGEFHQGDDFAPDDVGPSDDRPARPVRLSDYYMQETEVTNGEMRAYFKSHPEEAEPPLWKEAYDRVQSDDPQEYPAVGIPHDLAERFAKWAGGALPTEAQWEYAARSQGQPRLYIWEGSDVPSVRFANINSYGSLVNSPTARVKHFGKDQTDQGIYDLTGNVREWCRDVWAPYTVASEKPVVDPQGPPRSEKPAAHVIRGGSYLSFSDQFATTGPRQPESGYTADELAQHGAASDLGFRLVIEWPPRP